MHAARGINRMGKPNKAPPQTTLELPSEFRKQHDPFEVLDDKCPELWPVTHARCIDTLSRMVIAGTISGSWCAAGRIFQRDFKYAHFDPSHSADMAREGSCGSRAVVIENIEDAKQRIHDAMTIMGGHSSPCASAAWFILGIGDTIEEWARRQVWSGSRTMRPDAARGVFVGSLGFLEMHYGIGKTTR